MTTMCQTMSMMMMKRYNKKSRGFRHIMENHGNIELKQRHTFYTAYNFKNVLKVFVIKNGFKLNRLKNEKAIVTFKCVVENCTWRFHTSLT